MMIRGVLLDLSGVLYSGDRLLPGACEAVARLNEAGLALRFLTNTTRTPRRAILARLRQMGLAIKDEALFTPAMAARDWLIRHSLTPHLLIHPALAEDFSGLAEGAREAVVIGDAGTAFTYEALNAAFRRLMGGAEFLALARNRTFEDHDGALSLDAGPFVAALEFAVQRPARVLGKPSPDFFALALASMGCKADQAVMVGDDAEADVAGALSAGLGAALLVRTGKFRAGDEDRFTPRPSAVVDDIGAAAAWILGQNL